MIEMGIEIKINLNTRKFFIITRISTLILAAAGFDVESECLTWKLAETSNKWLNIIVHDSVWMKNMLTWSKDYGSLALT